MESQKTIDVVGLREILSGLTLDELKAKFIELGIESAWKNGANKQTAIEKGIKAYVALKESEAVKPAEEKPVDPSAVTGAVPKTPAVETEDQNPEEEFPAGEYDIDEETLIDYPHLIEMGFSIGDVLVVEEGKPYYKKDDSEGTDGIVSKLTPEEADALIKKENGGKEYSEDLINGVPRSQVNEELAKLNGGQDAIKAEQDLLKETEEQNPLVKTDESISETEVVGEKVVGEYEPEVIDETLYSEEDLLENINICTANCNQALPETRIKLLRKIDALQAALDRKQK